MKSEPSTTPDRILQSFPTRNRRFAGFALLLVAMALPAAGQTLGLGTSKNAAPAPQQAEPDPFGRSTPRGTIEGFIRATQRNDLVAAARYLELSDKQRAKTDELVRDLREVMERYYNEPLAAISEAASGNLDDGLPIDEERVPLKIQGEEVDILLKRVKDPQTGMIWLISSGTLASACRTRNVPSALAAKGRTSATMVSTRRSRAKRRKTGTNVACAGTSRQARTVPKAKPRPTKRSFARA